VPERWTSTQAGRHLAGRRKANTTPEVLLRRALHASGARFRLHRQLAKGCTPDLVLPKYDLAVFVDGCFWHGCPRHGRKAPWTGPNAQLWEAKMQRNAARDERSSRLAREHGWTVVRVWECDVREDAAGVAQSLLQAHRPPANTGVHKRRSAAPH
jgi:DNA mismatch endonuclease, patch repair protein